MQIFVVIPAYNEEQRLGAVLEAIPASIAGYAVKVMVVDDGSTDKTVEKARSIKGVQVVRHQMNLGKGAAAKTGCDAAYKHGADIIVLMDGDGQHSPKDIERIVHPLVHTRRKEDRKTELVIGTRLRNKKMPLVMRFGNWVMDSLARATFGITAHDTQSGFRAFRRDTYSKIRWGATNYEMEMEMLILAYRQHVQVREVKIETIYYDNYKGTTAIDGLRILRTLLKWRILWFREYKSLESFSL